MRNVRDYSYLAVLALCMVVVLLLNSGCREEQFYPLESINSPKKAISIKPEDKLVSPSIPMPKIVGKLAARDVLVFQGNKTYTEKQICKVLFRDTDVILALSPESPFLGYLEALQKKTFLGYLNNGFYGPQVQVSFDNEKQKVIVDIKEGARYKKGQIIITGTSDILKQEIVKRLKMTEDQARKAAGWSEENTYEGQTSNFIQMTSNIKSVVEGTLPYPFTWNETEWVCFDKSFIEPSNQYLDKLLNQLGYYNAQFDLKVVPVHENHTAELHLSFASEGVQPQIGTIDISGNTINTHEHVITYLGLKKGLPINDSLIKNIEYKLRESGRFRTCKVTPVIDEKAPNNSVIKIALEEVLSATPIGEKLSEKEELMQKVGKFFTDYENWQGDLHFTVSTSNKYLQFAIEGVLSPQKGLNLTETVGSSIANALVVQQEKIQFVCPMLGHYVLSSKPKGQIILQCTASPDKKSESGWSMMLGGGFKSDKSSSKTKEPGYVIQMDIPPAFWIYEVHKDETLFTGTDEDTAIIELKGEGGTSLAITADRKTGRIIEINIKGKTVSSSIRFQKGIFDKQVQKIQAQIDTTSLEPVQTKDLSGTILHSFLPLYLTHSPNCTLTLEQKQSAMKAWNRILAEDITVCFPSKAHVETEDDFSFTHYEAMGSMDNTMRFVMGGVFGWCHENLPQDHWLRILAHIGVLITSGHGQSESVPQEMQMLYTSDNIGPMGYLLIARAFKMLGLPAYRPFVERTRQSLSADNFRKDWMPLVAGESKLAKNIQCSLDNLRAHETEDIRLAALIFPPKVSSLFETANKKFKENSKAALLEVLDPLLTQAWESSLEQVIQNNLLGLMSIEDYRLDKNVQLIKAAQNGNLAAVQTLLADGADINARDTTYGSTALMVASVGGNTETVKTLLESGAGVNIKDNKGATALMYGATAGHLDVVRTLLKHGADVNAKDKKYGGTPLWMASSKGRAEVVKLLLEAGADVDATGCISLGVRWDTGWSDWSTDARSIVAETLKKSREAALKASSKTKTVHVTPLFLASQHGHIEVVKLLLEAGADVNVEVKDPEGVSCTPYSMAKEGGYIKIANLLKEHGAVK